MMTRKRLEEYKSNMEEIEELRYKLDHLREDDSLIGNDVIMDYRTGYPRPQAVVGIDKERGWRLKEIWTKRKDELIAECSAVELWIEEIPDGMTRRIFRLHYQDGKPQREVGKAVHISQTAVSKKISDFLKLE